MPEKIDEIAIEQCDNPNCKNEHKSIISVRDKFRSMKLRLCYECQGKIMHLVHQIWNIIEGI